MIETILAVSFIILGFRFKDTQYFFVAGWFTIAVNIDKLGEKLIGQKGNDSETNQH